MRAKKNPHLGYDSCEYHIFCAFIRIGNHLRIVCAIIAFMISPFHTCNKTVFALLQGIPLEILPNQRIISRILQKNVPVFLQQFIHGVLRKCLQKFLYEHLKNYQNWTRSFLLLLLTWIDSDISLAILLKFLHDFL